MGNKFYQWPPCHNCESLLPRAVLIHRICNMAYVKLDVMNVPLPADGEDFEKQLKNRMLALPNLEMDGQKFKSSRQIWDHLIETHAEPRIRQRLMRADSVYTYMIQQWCNESFINSLIYARWKKEENYQRFIAGVNLGPHASADGISSLRQHTLSYLKRTPIGDVDSEGFTKILRLQLGSLAKLIEGREYFEEFGKYPSLTDLSVFMIIQGLLSPDLEEYALIAEQYPELVDWYKKVDISTRPDRSTNFNQLD